MFLSIHYFGLIITFNKFLRDSYDVISPMKFLLSVSFLALSVKGAVTPKNLSHLLLLC